MVRWVSALAVVSLLFGCGSDSDDGGGAGRVQIGITDQAGVYDSVVLTIREVRIARRDADSDAQAPLVATLNPPVQVDVLSLQFAAQALGTATVPAGDYGQVRLLLAANDDEDNPANYVTYADAPNVKVPLQTPSGQQSGLKLNGGFTVEPGVLSTVLIDFDPARAIVTAGNSGRLNLKPTGIRLVEVTSFLSTYGAITGTVAPSAAWDDAVIRVVPDGQTAPLAVGYANPDDGSFRGFVPAGIYDVSVTATGFAPAVVDNVTVTVGADTAVGEVVLPPL
jgi:hypothetical protein